MEYKQREKRLRLLVSKLNKARKVQAKKVDILCNDLIAAQGDFIKSLDVISFTASFYESIVGTTDLNNLLHNACKLIKNEIADATVVFVLRQQNKFELHLFESEQPIDLEKQRLENYLTTELVENICKSNKICTLDCLLGMGLESNPGYLGKISAVTIPLGQRGQTPGFVLIYRSSENKLTDKELNTVAAITPGLSRAIQACRILSHSRN